MDFSNRLRNLRRKRNLSQSELGKLVGLHYTQIGRYERGTSKPTSEVLRKLTKVLEVTADYLIEGTTGKVAKESFQDHELLVQFKQIEKLESKDKEVIKIFLDAFIAKKKIQELVKK